MTADMTTDRPNLLGEDDARRIRRSQLQEAHVAPLTAFVKRLRHKTGRGADIPYFDPWDGGVKAEILFLLETPGREARLSGFISRNNPDETARNFFKLNGKAGICRKRTVSWNVVPWFIGRGAKIRAADLEQGLTSFPRFLDLLPNLRAVVFVGRKAEKARPRVARLRPNVSLFVCPHPSPLYVNHAPGNRAIILAVLRDVARYVPDTPAHEP